MVLKWNAVQIHCHALTTRIHYHMSMHWKQHLCQMKQLIKFDFETRHIFFRGAIIFTTTLAPRGHDSPTGKACTGRPYRKKSIMTMWPSPLSGPVPLICTHPCRALTSAASAWFCTSCSETRFSPASQSVLRCWPGEPSLGRTGISGDWISSPVQALAGV